MEQKYTICFVCTGNACRSPFAECVLKSMLKQEGMDNIEVFSRGTLDWGENPRDANMVRIARELGYDLKGMTTPITREKLQEADCIVIFDAEHRNAITRVLDYTNWYRIIMFDKRHLVQTPQLWIRTIKLMPCIRVWPRILWKDASG